jgi:Domain of unknown function (DU1801)
MLGHGRNSPADPRLHAIPPEFTAMATSRSAPKTLPTQASVADHIAARASPGQLADCQVLMALMQRLTGEPPAMWGPSIVGFGSYRYTHDSGRSGTMCRTGFAIRGRELVVYLVAEGDDQPALLARLGQHRMGHACLYIRRLADVDTAVLEQLVAGALAALRRQHG